MYIGIDLGGTKIAAALADKTGKILQKISQKTQSASQKAVITQLAGIITQLSKHKNLKGIGLGIPGQQDSKGRIFNIPNLPVLKNCQLVKELKKIHNYTYTVENDANAAALAELKFGAGKKLKNFIYVTISTGIGAGIILDGKLYTGANQCAGEAGHMIIKPDGPACGCGNQGCWETLGSGTALINMAKAKILNKEKTILTKITEGDLQKIDGKLIFTAAQKQDTVAREVISANSYYNALGITNLVNLFDPEAIIIGGGMSFNGKAFFEPLKKCLRIFKILNPQNSIKILSAGCRQDSGVQGALALVIKC